MAIGAGWDAFVDGLALPLEIALDPGRRVFAPFFAASAVLAFGTLLARGVSPRSGLRALTARRIWLHRSARADYALVLLKALLGALGLSAHGISLLAVAATTAGWLRHHAGDSPMPGSAGLAMAVCTLAAFLAEDATRFALHRAMHRVPSLWAFHKVHHSAEVLTPLSLYRTHPVESFLGGVRSALSVGLVTGVSAWAFGPSLRTWEILGVDAIGLIWTLLGANLRHSHVWLSYGPRIERVLLSPAQHQLHHSDDPRHFDRNYGTVLAVWDWLSGSLHTTTARRPAIRFGLPPEDPMAGQHGMVSLLLVPFVTALGVRRPVAPPVPARVLALASSLLLLSCSQPVRLDRAQLLASMGRCTVDAHQSAATAAEALATATTALASSPASDTARTAARAAWERTIDAWQVAEMLQYGPTAAFDSLGGQGLRAQVYAWPDFNRCLVEQQLVSRAYSQRPLADLATSTRGLATLEYLLFATGSDNACPATDPINMDGTWRALGDAELAARRAAYAAAVATDVVARTRAIVTAWEPQGFLAQFTTAGRGSTLFATQQEALSAAAEAIFHADTDLKDLRLGRPLGLNDCTTGTCPEALESPFAQRGARHLRNNLVGLRLLLEGCTAGENLGYDDLLRAAGAPTLATTLTADLDAVSAALDALPATPLQQQLASDTAPLRRMYDRVRELTSFLKMEFTMALQITPRRVEGDHD